MLPPWAESKRGVHIDVAPAASRKCGSLRLIAAKLAALLDTLLEHVKAEEVAEAAAEFATDDQLTILIRELGGKLSKDKQLFQAPAERCFTRRVPVDEALPVAPAVVALPPALVSQVPPLDGVAPLSSPPRVAPQPADGRSSPRQ